MTMEQVVTGWRSNRTATRELNDDFSRTVFSVDIVDPGANVGVNRLTLSALTPIGRDVFNWEAAEKRADWEESHGRFLEFNDIKDLLSNLHS